MIRPANCSLALPGSRLTLLRRALYQREPDAALLKRAASSTCKRQAKVCTMAKVKYIASANEIPAGQKFLLVMYGEKYAQTRHPLGLTITVARQSSKTVSELSFLTAVHTAKGIAKREGISEIFACTATTPWPAIPHPAAVRTSSA
jgi:hypothetical protein